MLILLNARSEKVISEYSFTCSETSGKPMLNSRIPLRIYSQAGAALEVREAEDDAMALCISNLIALTVQIAVEGPVRPVLLCLF